MQKYKVIIDTDPGVDDAACLIYAFFDKMLDIKLLTTVKGNVDAPTATRNLLHLLDRFNLDYPVAMGANHAFNKDRETPTAQDIHSVDGLGGYIPPKQTKRQPINKDAVTAMYEIISNGDGDIIPIVLGPHTNIALLLKKYPEIAKKIPQIVFMGASPYGMPGFPDHISFNISSDPEAFKYVVESKIPLVMVPSDMGRNKAYLTEEFVENMKKTNEVGAFIYQMYSTYWEHGYEDRRIATNDTCAYVYLTHRDLFICERITIDVNTTDAPGKTIVKYDPYGHIELTVGVDRPKFLALMEEKLHDFDGFKLN